MAKKLDGVMAALPAGRRAKIEQRARHLSLLQSEASSTQNGKKSERPPTSVLKIQPPSNGA